MKKFLFVFELMRSPLRPVGVVLWLLVMGGIFLGLLFASMQKYGPAFIALLPFLIAYVCAWCFEMHQTVTRFRRAELIITIALGCIGIVALFVVLSPFFRFSGSS